MIARRCRKAELMDAPELDRSLHLGALAGLRRINVVSRSAATLWPFLSQVVQAIRPEPLRVLDLACGSGDIVMTLASQARRAGLLIQCDGCDASPLAVETATCEARRRKLQNVSFHQRNVLDDQLPSGYDIVTCSLFLHHLSDEQAVDLLRRMAAATRDMLLISDLRRTMVGLTMAWVASRALTRSPIVRVDAIRSVAAAFTESEIASLVKRGQLHNCRLVRRWPQRWVLSWRKP
jgi:2-polyprenyl-3-methyl-5-hydroxy-6-metoxy-1,4-benzoquinol methylase